ncbi:hypothetical protein TGPRC2_268765 [Toxoplasma gondii TgCatPRC2]|uniref:Uncharacterized protein n=4 Tax=Toxoplasma gondii TaxID=5811 RepID=A0A151HN97_TOXGO|nr:hypothetical protein TGME49_268765 [Toxoplasma gondii ME49]EPT28265.1 hypothetical protein TGME49_268765 [Toxoplasma gondii ME49]KYF47142.1 hypothetical protein TGARI_268765 [Toxoplasma gondii ARI]KYK70845.1 hypothetical protein TGPRC2_268765 [Toxoplasma gondii TgCatPRC2]PIM01002.1 hypothetical protein TGCOUG_268765 [Toxoplasma gondii COUG]|eukprot:XP_018636554.1 hypothetical protein TGME49_268765 [Toxoplasma gondii ME49]
MPYKLEAVVLESDKAVRAGSTTGSFMVNLLPESRRLQRTHPHKSNSRAKRSFLEATRIDTVGQRRSFFANSSNTELASGVSTMVRHAFLMPETSTCSIH